MYAYGKRMMYTVIKKRTMYGCPRHWKSLFSALGRHVFFLKKYVFDFLQPAGLASEPGQGQPMALAGLAVYHRTRQAV
jgi:hypothetical protein